MLHHQYFTPVPELIHSYQAAPDSQTGNGVGGDEFDQSVMKFSWTWSDFLIPGDFSKVSNFHLRTPHTFYFMRLWPRKLAFVTSISQQ